MAERRMFAKTIVLSDAFLDMSISARCLYFTLGITAYDKGIVVNARTMARACGADQNDILELVENKFLKPLDNETYQIVHWYENNGIGETAKKRINYPYRKWRENVLERDGYKCVKCGSTDNLEAHHIKPFAVYPELRLEINNGVTLCHSCHMELHREERKKESDDSTILSLVIALKDSVEHNKNARFTYEFFKEKYGEDIFGCAQPKRALDEAAKDLKSYGIDIVTGIQVRQNGEKGNGFAIYKRGDGIRQNVEC